MRESAGHARLRRLRTRARSIRTRILAVYVGLLALAAAASVLVAREVLVSELDDRIDQELRQEVRELRRLAGGIDPADGRPFGTRAKRIFRVYLERNIPSRNEALLTFVDGRPFLRSRRVVPYRLDRDPALVARWGRLERTERGRVRTPAGDVEYLGVPVQAEGRTVGTFVVAVFRTRQQEQLRTAIQAVGGVGLAVLLVGSLLAWRLAETVLRPVRRVTDTAHGISETDLNRRIPVEGDDEIARLAATFNGVLDRLDNAFSTQKRFLDDAGHELRTPITIVRGHLELLGDDPEERRETVELVLDELDRMARLVDDLLLIARAGQPSFLRLAPVDLDALTEEVFAKVSALAPRAWTLERRGEGRLVADPQRVTQAMVQFAHNAVRHTDDGDPIWIGSTATSTEARLWVRDAGPGIAGEEQERIFGRFARGSTTRGEGSGLGLSIVEAIADAHHGRVEVESRLGAGSTFTLVVPRRAAT